MALIEPELYEAIYGHIKGRANRMADLDARTQRIVRGAPEVMVKISGFGRGTDRVHAHLTYIARHGKMEMENDRGETIHGRDELEAFFSSWKDEMDNGPRRQKQRDTVHVVLSMPEHVDSESVRNASREFAKDMFGKNHEYVFALHTDEPHPHCHLVIRCRGMNGRWLNPRKADLQEWRDKFAEKMREQGVDAEATPRFVRGVVKKAERQAIGQLAHSLGTDKPRENKVANAKLQEAADTVKAREAGLPRPPQPWIPVIAARQQKVREGWLSIAATFEREASRQNEAHQATAAESRQEKIELATRIRSLVASMPPVETERQQLERYAQLQMKPERRISTKHLERERGQERDWER